MIICQERGAGDLHMVQLMPLQAATPSSLASLKSRTVLPFWCRLIQVVPEKRPLKGSFVLLRGDGIFDGSGYSFVSNLSKAGKQNSGVSNHKLNAINHSNNAGT